MSKSRFGVPRSSSDSWRNRNNRHEQSPFREPVVAPIGAPIVGRNDCRITPRATNFRVVFQLATGGSIAGDVRSAHKARFAVDPPLGVVVDRRRAGTTPSRPEPV